MDFEPIYSLVTSQRNYEEIGFMTVYGIKAEYTDKEKTVYDISSDKSTVNNLILLLKENAVEFCHFEAIIEDILFDGTASR